MKLKFIAQNPITFGVNESNAKLLKPGKTYNVERIEEHLWHTKIFLKEFPEIDFNSVWFEEVK